LFFASFCSGEVKNSNLLLPFLLGRRKIQIYCFLFSWGSEKFKFIASFSSGEAKNSNLLLPFLLGRQKIQIYWHFFD